MSFKTQIPLKLDKFQRLSMVQTTMKNLLKKCSCQIITRIVMNTNNQVHFIAKIGYSSISLKMKKRSSALSLKFQVKNLNLLLNVSKLIKINKQRLQPLNILSVDLFRVQLVSLRQRTKISMDMKFLIKLYHLDLRLTNKTSKK